MKVYRVILLSAVFFLCACGSATANRRSEAIIRNGSAKVYRKSQIESKSGNKEDTDERNERQSLTTAERTKNLSELITEIKGVEEASVVVSGNTAIVGLKTAGHVDDVLLLKLKKEIDSIVKSDDNGIVNVAITARPELVSRVSKMLSAETSYADNTQAE